MTHKRGVKLIVFVFDDDIHQSIKRSLAVLSELFVNALKHICSSIYPNVQRWTDLFLRSNMRVLPFYMKAG